MTAYRFYYLDHADRARYGKAALWCLPMCVTAYMPEELAAKLVKEWNHRDREKRTWRYELCPPGDVDHPQSVALNVSRTERSQSIEPQAASIANNSKKRGSSDGREKKKGRRKGAELF